MTQASENTVALVTGSSRGAGALNLASIGVVHDFNNLLHVALGGLDLIRIHLERETNARASSIMEKTATAILKASLLSKRLLPASESELTVKQPVNVNAVTMSLMGLIELTVGSGIDISFELTNDDTTVTCDQNRLERALLNLVTNARNATKSGGSVIVRTFIAHDVSSISPGFTRHIAISVSDTGVGMSPETAARAFEPYYTEHLRPESSGIGLATVRSFVDELGGRAEIRSALGEGCSVSLYIPGAVEM
jgi:signal transduction histidine kinase